MHPAFRKVQEPDPSVLRYNFVLDGFGQLCPDGRTVDAQRLRAVLGAAQAASNARSHQEQSNTELHLFMPTHKFTDMDGHSLLSAMSDLPYDINTHCVWYGDGIGQDGLPRVVVRQLSLGANLSMSRQFGVYFATRDNLEWNDEDQDADRLRDIYTRHLHLRGRRTGSKSVVYPLSFTEFITASQPPIWATPKMALDGITLMYFEGDDLRQTFYRVGSA